MPIIGVVLAVCALVIVVVGLWAAARRSRAARSREILARCSELRSMNPRRTARPEAMVALERLRGAEQTAVEAERRVAQLRVPVPDPAKDGQTTEQVLTGLAAVLQDPRLAVAVAGGEQLLANLLEMSGPESLGHLAGAATEVFHSGLIDAVTSGPASYMANAAISAGQHLLEGGGVLDGAHESLAHLHAAGEHLAQGFDPSAAGGFHFPVVTMLLSSARELALLQNDKTTVERGLAHVALDTGAVAAGGFGGAKLGALIGTAIAPGLGTAIGGALGAIAGGITGRVVSQKAKAIPLRGALESYQSTLDDSEHQLHDSAIGAVQSVRERALAAQAEFERSIGHVPRLTDRPWANRLEELARALTQAQRTQLMQGRDRVHRAADAARRDVPRARWCDALTGGDLEAALKQALEAAERETAAAWDAALARLAELEATQGDPLRRMESLCQGIVDGGDRDSEASIAEFRSLADEYAAGVKGWAEGVAARFSAAATSVTRHAEKEARRHSGVVGTCRAALERCAAEVKRHQEALGIA